MPAAADHAALLTVQAELARLKVPEARGDLYRAKDNQLSIYTNMLYRQALKPETIDPATLAAARDLKIQLAWLDADSYGAAGPRRVENAIAGIDNFSGGPDQLAQFNRDRQRARAAAKQEKTATAV